MKPPVKCNWIDQSIEIRKFHIQQLKDESNWTLEKTAKVLQRSIGSVSQFLLIASWLKTHDKQIRKFNSMKDALVFIRAKQREHKISEID